MKRTTELDLQRLRKAPSLPTRLLLTSLFFPPPLFAPLFFAKEEGGGETSFPVFVLPPWHGGVGKRALLSKGNWRCTSGKKEKDSAAVPLFN